MSAFAEPLCRRGEPWYTQGPLMKLSTHLKAQDNPTVPPPPREVTCVFHISPKLRNAYRLCVAPFTTTRVQAALHSLSSTPRERLHSSPCSSPISPTTNRASSTHTGNTPAQTPTRFPSHICICPNDIPAYQTPKTTKRQAETRPALFTAHHRNASGKQPKGRCRRTQKAPTTVRRPSKTCNHCWQACPTANRGAKPNALAESTGQPRSRALLHSHSLASDTRPLLLLDLPDEPK